MSMASERASSTGWSCTRCGRSGEVTVPDGAGVYEALNLIEAAHAEKSPNCTLDLARVKVSVIEHERAPLDAEDECGGYGKCMTPAEYGPELVRPATSPRETSPPNHVAESDTFGAHAQPETTLSSHHEEQP